MRTKGDFRISLLVSANVNAILRRNPEGKPVGTIAKLFA